MIALSVKGISLSFGVDTVLKNVSFAINEGERLGIIGSNGAGKTSLFRIITGKYTPDGGEVYIKKEATVGILEQNPRLDLLPSEMTALEYMYTAHTDLLSEEKEINSLEGRISTLSDEGKYEDTLPLLSRLEDLRADYERGGGNEFRSRCLGTLLSLGFDRELCDRKIKTLSGGQYTRLALARLLATGPDILLLDEPTNHLDIDAVLWLEDFISSYKKTVVIISHDRYFLDRTTSKTLHLSLGEARLYNGGYTASLNQREKEAAELEHRYREQQKQIAKIRANIEFQRRCNREHNFVTIRSKEKQLDRMEKIELGRNESSVRMSFAEALDSAGRVIEAKGLGFNYGGERIFSRLSFLINRGERVLLLGKNGSGKSTLIKLIASRLKGYDGSLDIGYNVEIGYYDQQLFGLDERNTVFSELKNEYPEKDDLEIRQALALFLFVGDDVFREVSKLSGGERARLALSKLVLKRVNLLLLDEPTNHLDIGSAEALESALLAFDGTIVAVSHDRYFINKIATRIIELDDKSDRGLVDYPLEDYDDAYAEYMNMRRAANERKDTAERGDTEKSRAKEEFERSKAERQRRQSEQKRKQKAKERIAELERELEDIETALLGEAATDYKLAMELDKRKSEAEEELLSLYELVM